MDAHRRMVRVAAVLRRRIVRRGDRREESRQRKGGEKRETNARRPAGGYPEVSHLSRPVIVSQTLTARLLHTYAPSSRFTSRQRCTRATTTLLQAALAFAIRSLTMRPIWASMAMSVSTLKTSIFPRIKSLIRG